MANKLPQPPAEYYYALGRLVAIAALVEVELGLCARAAEGGRPYTTDWSFAERPGSAARLARANLHLLRIDDKDDLQSVIDEFERLAQVRNRAAHGVLSLDPMLAADEQWRVESPRNGDVALSQLLDLMRLTQIELHTLARRADRLRHAIAARHETKTLGRNPRTV